MATSSRKVLPTAPRKPAAKPAAGKGPSTAKSKSKDTGKKKPKSDLQKSLDASKAAEKRALKRENDAKKKSGKKYLEQAGNLEQQAEALKMALNSTFKKGLDQNLADVGKVLAEQIGMLKEGFSLRAQTFLGAADDTEKATSEAAESGFSNLVRERQDAMTGILEQGAGETDAMKAMLLSARNWQGNAQESNRSYFDSMRSVNSGITDLNVDTKTQMLNAGSQAEADREKLWQDYYNKRGEAFTQLGNLRGQQADYYAQAKEMGVKPKKGAVSGAKSAMEKAYDDASKEAGKSYVNQGPGQDLKDWTGQEQVKTRQENSNLAAALTIDPMAKAEGATLRKWDAA